MKRRRILSRIEEDFTSMIPFLPETISTPPSEEAKKTRKITQCPPISETIIAFFLIAIVLIVIVSTFMGTVSTSLIGVVAFSLLVMSSLLIFGNYIVKTGMLTRDAQIYFWMFAVSTALILFYMVQKGVLPLVFGGTLGQAFGAAIFEELISWLAYIIIALCVIGVIVIGLAARRRE